MRVQLGEFKYDHQLLDKGLMTGKEKELEPKGRRYKGQWHMGARGAPDRCPRHKVQGRLLLQD